MRLSGDLDGGRAVRLERAADELDDDSDNACDEERASITGGEVAAAAPSMVVEDRDFSAHFDGSKWTVSWKWKNRPPELKNKIDVYHSTLDEETEEKFEEEINKWIEEGWLKPQESEADGGVIPLMAVMQVNKKKVRPVLDFRELNEFVENHTSGDIAVCDESIRKWRQLEEPLRTIDLKAAYLQIHVDASLWKHQQVSYKGRAYFLTRLGFGLSCAPRIMSEILSKVLAQSEPVKLGTDHFMDDIMVQESIVTAEEVAAHLQQYGLETKPPESLDGGRVLGLELARDSRGALQFSRGNEVPTVDHIGWADAEAAVLHLWASSRPLSGV